VGVEKQAEAALEKTVSVMHGYTVRHPFLDPSIFTGPLSRSPCRTPSLRGTLFFSDGPRIKLKRAELVRYSRTYHEALRLLPYLPFLSLSESTG
jgi:hypothetical protein